MPRGVGTILARCCLCQPLPLPIPRLVLSAGSVHLLRAITPGQGFSTQVGASHLPRRPPLPGHRRGGLSRQGTGHQRRVVPGW